MSICLPAGLHRKAEGLGGAEAAGFASREAGPLGRSKVTEGSLRGYGHAKQEVTRSRKKSRSQRGESRFT